MGKVVSSPQWLLPAAPQMWPSMGGKKAKYPLCPAVQTHPPLLADAWTLYRKMLPLNSRKGENMEEDSKGNEQEGGTISLVRLRCCGEGRREDTNGKLLGEEIDEGS